MEKTTKEEEIQFVGVKKLTIEEQQIVNKLSTQYYPKIKGLVNNLTSLTLMIKTYDNEGARKKYSINLKLTMPSKSLVSDKKAGWDITKALHEAFQALMQEIKSKFRTDSQYDKAYD